LGTANITQKNRIPCKKERKAAFIEYLT